MQSDDLPAVFCVICSLIIVVVLIIVVEMNERLVEDLKTGEKIVVPEYYNEHGEPVRWEIVDAE